MVKYNMTSRTTELFEKLFTSPEIGKIDFKRDQYKLDSENLKSKLIKDILCIANAPGDDGYIVLGVKADKGRPSEISDILYHHDGAALAEIVNGVIDAPPIQFEYLPLRYKGKECAIIHVPRSVGRPHRPKKDFGILKKHVFYTRRASGNAEASIPEIRRMCLETIPVSDIARQKAKVSHHVIDELATLSMDERESKMYGMLKSIAPKIGLRETITQWLTSTTQRRRYNSLWLLATAVKPILSILFSCILGQSKRTISSGLETKLRILYTHAEPIT